jgi:DNA (cytosine-5)-methyltransferase 1
VNTKPLTVGSLFAGIIGGFDLGFQRAGYDIRWQVEIDPWARAVLAKHWPHVARYEDVREVGAHNLEPVDVICGGFPCTDISAAGKGLGITGPESGLWSEYARIIRELRPRYVVVENAPTLLGRGLGRVLGDLAAGGYDAEWDCVPAAAIGAPHLRDRLWLVAARDGLRHGRVLQLYADPREGADPNRWGRVRFGQSESAGVEGEPRRQLDRLREGRQLLHLADATAEWVCEPPVGRLADGVPCRVDRLRGLGNAVVPQIAEWIAHRITAAEQSLTEVA